MADASLADYIKANKIKPNRNPGAPNKGPKKPGQQKNNLKKTKQGGVKKAKNQQNVKKAKKQQNVNRNQQKGGKKKKNVQNGFMGGQAKKWRPQAANNIVKNFQSFKKPAAPQVQVKTGPAKIQITNLDFNVTEQDVQELFAEFGSLKKSAIHFTSEGKSMGVADLVYGRRADAIKAIKQYNGVQLDGRPMKISIQEQQQLQAKKPNILKRLSQGAKPISRGGGRGNFRGGRGALRGTFKPRGGGGGGQRGTFKTRGQRGTFKQRGGARGGARGGGAQQAKKGAKKQVKKKKPVKKEVTVEDLDKQLDAYIQAKS